MGQAIHLTEGVSTPNVAATKNHWIIYSLPKETSLGGPVRREDGCAQSQEVEGCGRSVSATMRQSYSNP